MIIRYRWEGRTRAGWVAGTAVTPLGNDLHSLLRLSRAELRQRIDERGNGGVPVKDVEILAPADGLTEVWAAGVTYETSQEARMEESDTSSDVYAKVYEAERPELFFKSVSWRVVGHGGALRVRADSSINVPEPELALLINSRRELIGYTVSNDMSSRSIEAENPLYLPQAKIYRGSCALGPGIVPAWEIADPYALELKLTIHRDGVVAWQGSASVGQLHRRLDDLADWLHRELDFPDGVWLSTGTCLVPELPFTVVGGDEVVIEIPAVGKLANPVDSGGEGTETPV